jgi:hypothetical protein
VRVFGPAKAAHSDPIRVGHLGFWLKPAITVCLGLEGSVCCTHNPNSIGRIQPSRLPWFGKHIVFASHWAADRSLHKAWWTPALATTHSHASRLRALTCCGLSAANSHPQPPTDGRISASCHRAPFPMHFLACPTISYCAVLPVSLFLCVSDSGNIACNNSLVESSHLL